MEEDVWFSEGHGEQLGKDLWKKKSANQLRFYYGVTAVALKGVCTVQAGSVVRGINSPYLFLPLNFWNKNF